jgi:hypothetical protein
MTDILVFTDTGDQVTVLTDSIALTVHSLTFIHRWFEPKMIKVDKERFDSTNTNILVNPWQMLFHLYFELPNSFVRFDRSFASPNYNRIETNLTDYVFLYKLDHYCLDDLKPKTVSFDNLPTIAWANLFKDCFIECVRRQSLHCEIQKSIAVMTFQDKLELVDCDDFIETKDGEFGNLDKELNLILSTKSYDHLIIVSNNFIDLKESSSLLKSIPKVSIISLPVGTSYYYQRMENVTQHMFQNSTDFYKLSQKLCKHSLVGTEISFVEKIKIHVPGQNNSLLTADNILRLKNEFLKARDFFSISLVNDSIVDWLLKINDKITLLLYFTNAWPSKPPKCIFVKFQNSNLVYDQYTNSSLFIDDQNHLCLPLLSSEWSPSISAVQVVKEILALFQDDYNQTFAKNHKSFIINYERALNYYQHLIK